MKLDENHLLCLAAVVEAGSVTEGAALIGSSQPAVSRVLSLLEKRVGEALFITGKRPLQPTPLGRQLAFHGKSILVASRKASETVQGFRSGTSGRVRIGGVPFFMDAVISGVLARFQVKEPEILFDQSYGHFSDLVANINADQIDLAITPIGTQEISSELQFEPLLPARNVIACNANHPLMLKRKLSKADFLKHPWVSPLPGSPLMLDLNNILMMLGINELSIRYTGGSLLSVLNYISETDALAILPLSVAYSVNRDKRLAVLPLDIPQPERMIGIVSKRSDRMNPACAKFSNFVSVELAKFNTVIGRYEKTINWGRGPFMAETIR